MNHFELKLEKALEFDLGGIRRVIGFCRVINLVDLITQATLDSNPRKPRRNDITDAISKELAMSDHLFSYKTRGLLIGAATVEKVSSTNYKVAFGDQQIEGILDGGHNTLAIGLAILSEATGRQTEISKLTDWKHFKEFWLTHSDALHQWRDAKSGAATTGLATMQISVDFIHPANEFDPASIELFKRSIIDICSARNTSTPLRTSTMLDKLGLLDPLKERVPEPYYSRIQWEQNGQGVVKADNLISMALVPFKVLLRESPKLSKSGRALTVRTPNSLYAGRTAGVRDYGEIMQHPAFTERTADYKRVIVGPEAESVFDIASEMPAIYDLIYELFPAAYESVSSSPFDAIPTIRDWNRRHRNALSLPYAGTPVDVVFPEALIQPILRGLGVLMEVDTQNQRLKWRKDPIVFLKSHINALVGPIPKAFSDVYNFSPDQFGKDKFGILYSPIENQFRRFVGEIH